MAHIIYTHTDEAPMLASASLLPIISAFTRKGGIDIVARDISLSGRIIAALSHYLPEHLRQADTLSELSALTQRREANIIKLPNISASLPQLHAAISELQNHGYELPDYPVSPVTDLEHDIRARYDSVIGSAVNPVLREGNSDRRAPRAVKNYARTHPHSMAPWSADSRTRVATMDSGDFKHNEVSYLVDQPLNASIVFQPNDGPAQKIRTAIPLTTGDIIDASVMSIAQLDRFLATCVAQAKESNLLFSVHLKATMMKVSDPVIFGRVVRAFFPRTFARFEGQLADLKLSPDNGLGAIFAGLEQVAEGRNIRESFDDELASSGPLAMVNSDRGITNLHVPSDVIVDASMPAMIRHGGKMWGPSGEENDTLAVIPDSSYAGIYQVVIDDCKAHGAFDPVTMGSVPNVGLMAQKAEEYGSHDKTFVAPASGRVDIIDDDGRVLLSRPVDQGDIFRSCVTKDAPIHNWISLAVQRARLSSTPVVFWLDSQRAHDRIMISKVESALSLCNTEGLNIRILDPCQAAVHTLQRLRKGLDTISATGNVLRDYLTDLFPIMELGTSAKMLSVVPLMAGGGLFETGAGGSAPKLAQQLIDENHLRWDSLGEFLAVAESLRHCGQITGNHHARVLADCLDIATERVLTHGRSAQRHVGEPDNRSSHLWLATYWAQALAKQNDDEELQNAFASLSAELTKLSPHIDDELLAVQGQAVDVGGYYHPDPVKLAQVMRPSAVFNHLIDQ
ncbi:NADP-dependent isocitrate dehydrogenase [Arcanobacterium buesumense]|uniref:Isocitrate dehydrogenase [NADP] n=1 Tax=Arcanobacterium buesumense TaxID=2722751 RepID=A0A6H2EMS4_9ACTO|nr:NADP-dependent isocitrate dehydrogenase [Arcanobacterium buesumense]QJC22367.1 NADP-dependent isocitrate dehydrogenase [Arcanobacterium buesumense]